MGYDYSLLKTAIKAKFHGQDKFAKELGIARTSLYSKLMGLTQFKQDEIAKSAKLLEIKEDKIPSYFFTPKVQ